MKKIPRSRIVCGKAAGLPYDNLMTDIISGCLPKNKICYNDCSAAKFWISKGFDFGHKRVNIFDKNIFLKYVESLPKEQRWLRQGWMSDCSHFKKSWDILSIISEILSSYNIHLLIITKIFKKPSIKQIKTLIKNKAEIRVSISALDTDKDLKYRLEFLEQYRSFSGKAIPYLISSKYRDYGLNMKQDNIIEFIIKNNYIASEHPLRINKANTKILKLLSNDGFWHPKFHNEYWFGRIFYNIPNFILPPPTFLKPEYELKTSYYTLNKDIKIAYYSNLPTFEELKNKCKIYNKGLYKHGTYTTNII